MPLISKLERSTLNRKSLPIFLLAGFFIVQIIGTPMLVSARNWLQDRDQNRENVERVSELVKKNENYLLEKSILQVLSQSNLKLKHAMAITTTVIGESKKHDIPVSLLLAIMKKESEFNIYARSSVNAMGLMQIHPLIWDSYTKKLNLDVTRKKAFDPALNIMVASALLSDLRLQYQKKGYDEDILWEYVLSAYYAGSTSLKDGLKKNHRYYVRKVREYEQKIRSAI
ncbi:MAG: transglycosylase SLT domain-containing protein [Deltaproteobacteria bacterium]|nr:transglycosylase SLT domain-containing protein [Deltaproteobacteria bacterium]